MARKLTKALALIGLSAPAGVFALGLGDIHLHTALNQPLRAEIDLLSTKPGEVEDVTVRLASGGAFARAGVERAFVLTKLRFQPLEKSGGAAAIEVSTEGPVQEPFLDFLIEVNWPSGRVVREYTLLLDPPVSFADEVAPTVADPRGPAAMPRAEVSVRSEVAPPSPVPVSPQPLTRAPAPVELTDSGAVAATEYGPTRANETLWGIAERVRPDASVSVYQTMMALYESNHSAFFGDNINSLKRGVILRIPDRSEIVARDDPQARIDFARQIGNWDARQGEAAARQVASDVSALTETLARQQPAGAAAPEAELRLVATGTEVEAKQPDGAGADPAELERLRKELMVATEAVEATGQENADLRSRVLGLEEQISSLRRLLGLKDEQLAELQARLAESTAQEKSVADVAVVQPQEEQTDFETLASIAESLEPETLDTPIPSTDSEVTVGLQEEAAEELIPVSVETVELAPTEPEAAQSLPGEIEALELAQVTESTWSEAQEPEGVESVGGGVQKEPQEPAEEATVVPVEPEPSQTVDRLAEVEESPASVEEDVDTSESELAETGAAPSGGFFSGLWGMLAIGAAGLGVLGAGLGLLLVRRKSDEKDSVGRLGAGEAGDRSTASLTEEVEADTSSGEESSFLSDFTPSDIEAIQTEAGEVDPLSEADVYIAYGKYQQAEDLIKLAIENKPERAELKLKLLEIYYATKNAPAFASSASDFQPQLEQKHGELWDKILVMGMELCPDSRLFGGSEEAAVRPAAPQEQEPVATVSGGGEADEDLEFSLDFDTGEQPQEGEFPQEMEPQEVGLHQDIEPQQETERSAEATPPATGDEDRSLDFDLNLEEIMGGATPEEVFADEPEEREGEKLDLDLGLASLQEPALESAAQEPEAERALELEGVEVASAERGDSSDFSGLVEEEGSADQLSELDEVGTKLDLARAYADMGDAEGARSILEEVISEGSDAQKQEADELIAQLSSP
jgi:pilus assembly protein FimV